MDFKNLMRYADQARRHETDIKNDSWWAGYIRGLRYAHFQTIGQEFGCAAEHELFLAAEGLSAPNLVALGRGYRAGLEMRVAKP